MNLSKMKLLAAAGLLSVLAIPAYACQGNMCMPSGDAVYGGGGVWGAGNGVGFTDTDWSGVNGSTPSIVTFQTYGTSESGFNGSFRFAEDDCGECEADTNAVFGTGFSRTTVGTNFAAEGADTFVGSHAGGEAFGEGFAFSGNQ